MHFERPSTATSIFASTMFAFDALANTYTVHPASNLSIDSLACPGNPGGSDGSEKPSPLWLSDRHPEQTAISEENDEYGVFAGVCDGLFEDPPTDTPAVFWRLSPLSTFTSSTWTKTSLANPPAWSKARQGAEMVWLPDQDVYFIYGIYRWGVFCFGSLSAPQIAIGCANANDFTEITPGGVTGGTNAPTAQEYMLLFWAPSISRLLLFGGGDSTLAYTEIWEFDPANPSAKWTKRTPSGGPPNSVSLNTYYGSSTPQPSAAFDSDLGLIYYAQITGPSAPQGWVYDIVANTWAMVAAAGDGIPDPDGTSVNGFGMTYDTVNHWFVADVYNPSSLPSNNASRWKGVWQ
jgi:hypothetical protein